MIAPERRADSPAPRHQNFSEVLAEVAGVAAGASGTALTRQQMFDLLKPIARGLVQTFGDCCEVVIHDFADPERSIVWIEGNVTDRRIGGSVTEIGMKVIRGGNDQQDVIGYVQNNKDGKILKSSTLILRDPDGKVFGCFCINLDVTELVMIRSTIGRWLPDVTGGTAPIRFSDQIEEVLARILETATATVPKPPSMMQREDRVAFIAVLDQAGAFGVQRAVPTIADHLGVSRTTVYTYLDEVRSGKWQPPG